MPRCSECKKFVSLDENEPEVNDVDIDEEGHITATVRIVNVCAECGEELTEAELVIESDFDLTTIEHTKECTAPEITIDEGVCERITRSEGKGRAAKKFYGAMLTCKVYCTYCEASQDVEIQDDIQASAMETLS